MFLFDFFLKNFPPPRYLTMPTLGIDISDNSIKYISLAFKHNVLSKNKVELWGEVDIPAGVVEAGQVKDPSGLATALNQIRQKTGFDLVRLSLPEEKVYLFETEINKNIPFKETKSLLEFKLEENVPVPSSEILFDYSILPADNQSNSNKLKVVVTAYARDLIDAYFEVCTNVGFRPVSFEIEFQAMARAVVSKKQQKTCLIVDFGKSRTGVGIVYKNNLLYTSTIGIGGSDLSKAIRSAFPNKEYSESELTKIKNQYGLLGRGEWKNFSTSLETVIDNIKDEIAIRIKYWHLRDDNIGQRSISEIILCGGSSNLKGLPEYLTEKIGIKTRLANVWENVLPIDTTVPPITYRHSFGYSTAIGLALRKF